MSAPVYCGQCGALLAERPGVPIENRTPCACGSTARRYSQSLDVTIKTRTSLGARQKRPGVSGFLVELFVGKQPRKALGGVIIGWVDKIWRKDKPADRYIEHVVSEEGEILKDVDEPSRAHREHGSDRPELKAERLKAKGKMTEPEPTIVFQEPGITIAFDPVAHTLAPYPSIVRPDGTNHGFVDLRDRPELVDSIPEIQENPFLRNLLIALNRKGSRFMSNGCGRGPAKHSGSTAWPFAVCAYTTIAFRDLPANRSKDSHVSLAHSVWEKFEPQSRENPVLLELTIEPLKHLWGINDAFALDLKMIAHGRTEQEAMAVLRWLGPAVAEVLEAL